MKQYLIKAILFLSLACVGFAQKQLVSTNNLSDVSSASTARTNLGLAISTNVQAYDADLTTWAGVTPGANVATFLATPTLANLSAAISDANIARTDAAQSFTGVQTFSGSFIRTPATIAITNASPDTGTIDITNGYSQASVADATTLDFSGAGTAGQFITLDIICDATSRVVTLNTASDITITAAASSTNTVLLRSDGSGWIAVGGSPSVLDLTADTTPDTTAYTSFTSATTGAVTKSTLSEVATTVRGTIVEKIAVFSVDGGGSAITTGTVAGTSRLPYACTLTGWSITATAATGTNTIKIWCHATATAIPVTGDSINTSGVSLSSGTAVKSTTLTDFTDTTFAADDMFRCSVTAVDGTATDLTVTLYGTRL